MSRWDGLLRTPDLPTQPQPLNRYSVVTPIQRLPLGRELWKVRAAGCDGSNPRGEASS
jgi:hypothetical protein